MLRIALLLLLLLVAAVTDVTRHRIYNWTTYPGIIAGVVVNVVESDAAVAGLQESVAGLLVCGFIMLVCFVLFNIGGGDVKLMTMMGAFLGVWDGVEALLWTFVLGGIMGTAVLVWQIGVWRIVVKTVDHLRLVVRSRSWVPLTPDEREPLRRTLFLAPAGFVAVCLVARHYVL